MTSGIQDITGISIKREEGRYVPVIAYNVDIIIMGETLTLNRQQDLTINALNELNKKFDIFAYKKDLLFEYNGVLYFNKIEECREFISKFYAKIIIKKLSMM